MGSDSFGMAVIRRTIPTMTNPPPRATPIHGNFRQTARPPDRKKQEPRHRRPAAGPFAWAWGRKILQNLQTASTVKRPSITLFLSSVSGIS